MTDLTNQGRPFDSIMEDVALQDLVDASRVARLEVSRHPSDATCECPAIEVLALLYEHGYRVVRAGG